jgi:hypothetical protein
MSTEKTMNEIIIKLDFHKARKTPAETYWKVQDPLGFEITLEDAEEIFGYIKRIYSTKTSRKTHWYEYYIVFNPDIKFKRIRISNRGNFSISEWIPVEKLKISEEEKDMLSLIKVLEA